MKKFVTKGLDTFFRKELEFRVRLFHVLAITGVMICVIMTAVSLAGEMYVSALINFGAGLVSLFLLIYSAKKQKYQFCYMTTVIVIFFLLFPSLFFTGGGYRGGMPFFFVFAVVFTVYMLDGWKMLAVTAAELLFYAGLFVMAYRHPEKIVPFATEWDVVVDGIIGLVTVSVSLGATMFVQLWMYKQQQKDLEQAQQEAEAANRAKSAFLANMSHEIRTPIHMILGMNEIIQRESRSRQVREYSEKIDETSKMLLSLVDSILDVSKIESGKMELLPAPYETANLVQTLALISKTYCSQKKLNFIFHVADDLPPVLLGDLVHIRQIAANFLSNAAKYTPKGSITLSISQEPGPEEDEIYLCLSVQDTGIGICRDSLPTLFEAFTRADLAAHRSIAGTGLGLTIVRELTELMNGTVSVESDLGAGSTFSVRIPQKVISQTQQTEAVRRRTFRAPQVRMLVVDDNEGNLSLMRELLRPTEIRLDTASSGPECIRMARQQNYHVILMDYMMPEMDGLETVKELRRDPAFRTPVIALTADATPSTEQKLLDGGFAAFLTKPIPWGKLQEALLSFLPQALVQRVEEPCPEPEEDSRYEQLEAELIPYGVTMNNAMDYFDNNIREYARTAQIFVRHDAQERARVEQLWKKGDCAQLRYPVHALKGKARNLGMTRLGEVCAYLETLCTMNQLEEIQSLMPHMMFLWNRGREGMELLLQTVEPEQSRTRHGGEPQELRKLLREYRRRPALECLEGMLAAEADPALAQLLREISAMVEHCSFDRAEQGYETYLEQKNGGEK